MTAPAFRRLSNGQLCLANSEEARLVKKENQSRKQSCCLPPSQVKELAIKRVKAAREDSSDHITVLGQYTLQFGVYRGKTFKWLLENCLGYVAYLLEDIEKEKETRTPLSAHKFAFKIYARSFAECLTALDMRKRKNRPNIVSRRNKSALSGPQKPLLSCKPAPIPQTPLVTSAVPAIVPDDRDLADTTDELEMCSIAEAVEHSTSASQSDVSPGDKPPPSLSDMSHQIKDKAGFPLPDGWRRTLPKEDHGWISRALFKTNPKTGKAELDIDRINKVWWVPPLPCRAYGQLQNVSYYFAHPLLLWMPKKIWGANFNCPEPSCNGNPLTSAGLYHRVRKVLDEETFYNMAAEYLECSKCKKKRISWSRCLLEQLDMGHQVDFPVVMTYKNACDISVVRRMRARRHGNSSSLIHRQLLEEHRDAWLTRTLRYLTDCESFKKACKRGILAPMTFEDPPDPEPVPSAQWLLTAYMRDMLPRLGEIKSSITSTFGNILKMDSTKKVTKKLAGHCARTASWATNVGNEHGQVLMSVLTCSEGSGLADMATGLMKRYKSASVPPPKLLYVDRDCCEGGSVKLRKLFRDWPDLVIRLDIWHCMRRFALGCTTDAHPRYSSFMGKLSRCFFIWSTDDLERLKTARKYEMQSRGIKDPSEMDVVRNITKKEFLMHCRRRTRGAEESSRLIHDLLTTFSGPQGNDSLGVPLLDSKKIWHIYESQKRHLRCIQDPDDVPLYTQVNTIARGGIDLPVYRCARGSTSLESFHLHLNRFIPGTCASDVHFQAYLLEGLFRWNANRAAEASGPPSATPSSLHPHSYSLLLNHAVDGVYQRVLGKNVEHSTPRIGAYTGELIGVEYLYNQTGRALQDCDRSEEEDVTPLLDDEDTIDEGYEEEDLTFEMDRTFNMETMEDETADGAGKSTLQGTLDSSATAAGLKLASASTTEDKASFSKTVLLHHPRHSANDSMTLAGTLGAGVVSPAFVPVTESEVASTSTTGESKGHVHSLPVQHLGDTPSEFLGPDNIRGYDKVDRLAQFLAELRHDSVLSEPQAAQAVQLWNDLEEYDKQPTFFRPRYRKRPLTGRFKAPKSRQESIPGVESTKRCFIGSHVGPAQWPNCNRYVEATITKLCDAFPNARRKQGSTIQRWSLVISAYKGIRQCIINNHTVMDQTGIQLPEINNTTLNDWYHQKQKKMEKDVLDQGVVLQPAPLETRRILPANIKPTVFPTATFTQPYIFVLPVNTVGTAPCKTKRSTDPSCSSDIPQSTQYYRRKRMQAIQRGDFSHKRYTPRTKPTVCKRCGGERDPASHKQFYGNWLCQKSNNTPYDEWLADLKAKGCGKKKKI